MSVSKITLSHDNYMNITTSCGGRYEGKTKLLVGAAVLGLLMAPSAYAADDLSADKGSGIEIEEIVITSRKRAESMTDIPDAIVAFTAQNIEDAGIDGIEDVTLQVPNFSLVDTQNPGTVFLNIRGIGQYRNSEAPVAIVIDGVQMISTDAITQELFDIQQIEVLKGPQGALFGRNASGGAINIVTKKPGNEVEGRLDGTYGNGSDVRARAMISGPIVQDKIFARLSGSVRNFGGVIENVTTGQPADFADDRNLRLRVIAEPNDRLSIDLRASYSRLEAGSSYFAAIVDKNGFALNGVSNNFSIPVTTNTEGRSNRELQEYAVKLDYDLEFATLTSVSSYSKTRETFFQDLDFTRAPVLDFGQDRKVKAWSEEFRITSESDGPFQWMVGVFYLDSQRQIDTDVFISLDNIGLFNDPAFSGGTLSLNTFDFGSAVDLQVVNLRNLEDNLAWAVFGNVSYDVTDKLEVTFGLRYDQDKRKQINLNSGDVVQRTFDLLQPKVQIAYQPTEDINLYASWGRGFRSGGFNQQDIIRGVYDAEEVSTAEVGFKSEWMDGMLTANGAAFWTKFTNRQDFIFVIGVQTIVNLPKARIFGGELEFHFRPTENLDLFASGGILDTEIQSEAVGFDPTLTGLPANNSFKGNDIPLAYGWSYKLGAQYTHQLDGGVNLVGRIDYSARGNMAWELANQDRQNAVHLVNVRLAVEYENVTFAFWAENLFDTNYFQEFVSREFAALPTDLGFPAAGRRYGLTATVRF